MSYKEKVLTRIEKSLQEVKKLLKDKGTEREVFVYGSAYVRDVEELKEVLK